MVYNCCVTSSVPQIAAPGLGRKCVCVFFFSISSPTIWSVYEDWGSIQVSGDVPTHPSLRPNPNPIQAPTQTLDLTQVDASPESWIDQRKPYSPIFLQLRCCQGSYIQRERERIYKATKKTFS